MFDNARAKLFNWAVKQQIQADPSFIRLSTDKNPRWTKWTGKNAVDEGYKASVWVYATINKKARAAASVPWYVYKKNAKGEYERIENHPLQLLIDKPNPFTSRNNMVERMIMQLELAGNALHHVVTIGGVPVELWNIMPDQIKPIPHETKFIENYKYTGKTNTSENIQVPAKDIIHHMYLDPSNPYWGIAPLQVAAKTVDTDVEAVSWNKVALQNRAVTDGAFTIQNPLTTQQYQELRQQIREQHQGAQNARTPWILGGGAQWNQMSLSPADMDFINGRRMTREDICAVFSVPPPLVGILDKANYANMQEARRVFWLDTVIPLLDDLKESFNRSLTPLFGEDVELDYDTSSVDALAENVNEKIDAANKLWGMGLPFNAINNRLDLGFDEVEGGDIGYLPASLLPANMAQAAAAATTNESGADEGTKSKKSEPRPELKAYNLRTDEQKARYWKSFERQRSAWYVKFQRAAAEQFAKEGKAVAAAYNSSGGDMDKALAAVDSEAWRKMYVQYYKAIVEDFGGATYEGFKSSVPSMQTKAWNPFSRLISDYIFKAAAEKVTKMTDYTKLMLRGWISVGRDNGDGIATIARDLAKNFEDMSTNRAFTIARTEVVAASNYGSYAAAEQASEETGDLIKEWVDSGDNRVRESHEDVNGETVKFYTKFSNGLMYPGDMNNGAAADVIKCRCTCIYHPAAYAA